MGVPPMSVDTAIFSTIAFGIVCAIGILALFLRSISKERRAPLSRQHTLRKAG